MQEAVSCKTSRSVLIVPMLGCNLIAQDHKENICIVHRNSNQHKWEMHKFALTEDIAPSWPMCSVVT